MTTNDHGHINNLDEMQMETLKHYWLALTNAICSQSSLPADQIANSVYGDELFYMIGYENPDVLPLQWLRICKWNINNAVQKMMDMLKWRHEWGVQTLLAKGESDLSCEEIKTGKCFLMGYDKAGRPINYVSVNRHVRGQYPQETTQKLTVLTMETVRKLFKSPVETSTIVFDLTGFGLKNMDYQHVKFFVSLIENYYPELFGHAIILNAPWIFSGCWAIISKWLDPAIRDEIQFVRNEAELAKYIDPSLLPRGLNGAQPDFEYIPPTANDEAMAAAFIADVEGKTNARANHQQAAQHFLNITLQWTHDDTNTTLLAERIVAAKRLRDAFETLVPYVNTRTHYHRIGAIKEQIFQITYDRLHAEMATHS
ncbi:unnamed protein product [Rotaria socialis]|uniref:CRAL-TRIO domain-containing protein n=1 Tax=Rotaria socialis TaxID=392032 RepID=A0A820U245_9BILA|nr:unnamed protein product [Rotaria socialis]CAF3494966.1 unnamed protein product [Rotaria socialis]CAF3725703.1 unnamed protein product [Rotaria socialis]CAF3737170.1 unnamed protein product [Rotaria socialis]CAF4171196.1 unnamed protein product [Rotaria socialis]